MRGALEGQGDLFDYGVLDEEARAIVNREVFSIHKRCKRAAEDIIEIGLSLKRVKEVIGHGNFLPWLEAEFGWGESTALRFMQVAKTFGGKSVKMTDLAPSALYALASPSTPEPVREAVIAKAEAGEKVTPAIVKELREAHEEVEEAQLVPDLEQEELFEGDVGHFEDHLDDDEDEWPGEDADSEEDDTDIMDDIDDADEVDMVEEVDSEGEPEILECEIVEAGEMEGEESRGNGDTRNLYIWFVNFEWKWNNHFCKSLRGKQPFYDYSIKGLETVRRGINRARAYLDKVEVEIEKVIEQRHRGGR